jgi:multidrug resistance efflux pump
VSNWGLEDTDNAQLQAEITQISSRVADTIEQVAAERVDFLLAVNAGDSFCAGHGDASAIGWVGAS